jgi:NAD(P)-dependent dehydrogenase (short-subunit alcohol dehydrogenase family)
MTVEGKSFIVTGGGSGIGAACAHLLAESGAAVTICGRTQSKLSAVADEIEASGGRVHPVVADVTAESDVERLVSEAVGMFGALDGVVANAGRWRTRSVSPDRCGGVHARDRAQRVEHDAVRETRSAGAGQGAWSFVGMSSIAGHATHLWFGAYPVAKAAIESIMQSGDEYGPLGVRFRSVRPGFITTEIMGNLPRDSAVYRSYLDNTPMNGVGEPEDVALLVRFLLSGDSRWITGQEIGVDGGHTLRRGPDFTAFAGPIALGLTKGEI